MQNSELVLQCCECANRFTSATGLLRHFAEHAARDRQRKRRQAGQAGPSSASATETASESSRSRQSSTDSCGEDSTPAPTHCKLARFDLQKRLETCVGEVIQPEPIEVAVKEEKEDENSSLPPSPDTKATDDYSPLTFCVITMEDEEKAEKKSVGRKQLEPKKINRKTENLRKLAPKPEGSTLESLLQPSKKKYACHLCNKVFGWSTDLKRHILVHTGERPFKCKTCQATFTRNFLLQKHQSKVHPCKPKDTEVKITNDKNIEKNPGQEYVTLFSVKEELINEKDSDDEDKLVITEEVEEKSAVVSLSESGKWKDRRCSDLKREMFKVTPIKVLTM